MPSLRLDSASDSLDLDYVAKAGYGIQVLSGVTGLGLPPVASQWLEGAGDGATFRGRRVLTRDIDLPLYILGRDRDDLKYNLRRLAVMLAGKCTLYFIGERGDEWSLDCYRVGGGDFTYGVDTTGNLDLNLVVTMRAGDPYFTATTESKATITSAENKGLLTGSLVNMNIASGQAIGEITLDNDGDAPAYPVWNIYGPGNNFKAISPDGQTFWWQGTLNSGDVLTVDTLKGTVVDQTGANRYASLAPMPRFWSVPAGRTMVTASLSGVTVGTSKIECTWRARRWAVV